MTTDADVRADLASAHDAAWASLSRPGTWWSAAARRALARTAADSMWVADPPPPWVSASSVPGALADDALDRTDAAIAAVGLGDPARHPVEALADLTDAMMPLGSRLGYLLRERSLDDDEELRERWARIDRIVTDAVRRAQADGRVRPDLPALWVGDAWFWLVVAAWEGIEAGRIAPLDGSRLVLSTLLDGAAAP